jgi:hypothetical protein
MITHKERIQACIKGEVIDHPPVALWRHFPIDDQAPGTLAKATLKTAIDPSPTRVLHAPNLIANAFLCSLSGDVILKCLSFQYTRGAGFT